MSVVPGTRLGPYEILAPLGAGGMGEVYRARDGRIGRDVAVKVLPGGVAANADDLRRLQDEARAAGQLAHPNVLAIYDVGVDGSAPYVVSELLEGETLRQSLRSGPLPARKAIDHARQIARGLAAAHEKGIVHRDLKPENVFVTNDGILKILDFGLAKTTRPAAAPLGDLANLPTQPIPSDAGGGGTAPYMSPEQVRARDVDGRSDIFSLGAILYEMLAGRRAFAGESGADALSAILREDPPGFASLGRAVPEGLERIVRRCLEKKPEERFQSARDLSFALEAVASSPTLSTARWPVPRRRRRLARAAALVALAAAAAALAWIAGRRAGRSETASYRQLTFRRGSILSARFVPGSSRVVYGAAWDGEPFRAFAVEPGRPESSPLALPPADVVAVSRQSDLLLVLKRSFAFGWISLGTLARAPLGGGAPRELFEGAQEGDFFPDGERLAVLLRARGGHRLEAPAGRVLHETTGWISHVRVSPRGDRVAFLDHPVFGDDRGRAVIADLAGRLTPLGESFASAQGLAFSPDGDVVYVSAAERGVTSVVRALRPGAAPRVALRAPGRITLHDVAAGERALVSRDAVRSAILGLPPGETAERDLSWLDQSAATDLSADGKTLLFTEWGDGGGPSYGVYLRRTDGAPPVRLGDGQSTALSPDGRWALAILFTEPPALRLLPTAAGEAKTLDTAGLAQLHWARWMPDGRRVLVSGNEAKGGVTIYLLDVAGGPRRVVTDDGGYLGDPTPDGRFVAVVRTTGTFLVPVAGGEARKVPGVEEGERPLRFSADGRYLFVHRAGGGLPVHVDRVEVATGKREEWKRLAPADATGVASVSTVQITPDGAAYTYTGLRLLSELYLVEGFR